MRAQTVNYNREGSPYDKLGIGRHGIRHALLSSSAKIDSQEADGQRRWLEESHPDIQELLEFNPDDPLAFTDYYGFDDDWYLEEIAPEWVDYDEFHNDWYYTGPDAWGKHGAHFKMGKLQDGSKVAYYQEGLGSGYIAKKEWLK